MVCHSCGKAVEPGQRFCGACGADVRNITTPTEPVPADATTHGEATADDADATAVVDESADEWSEHSPVWAATGSIPLVEGAAAGASDPAAGETSVLRTTDLPATEALAASDPSDTPTDASGWPLADIGDLADLADDVWAPTSQTYQGPGDGSTTATMPIVPVGVGPDAMPIRRTRVTAVTVFSVIAAIVALVGSFTVIVGVESDQRIVLGDDAPPTFRLGTWLLDDLADNLSIGVLIAAVLMVIGGVAAAFRWRWGSGLAGGAGLALAGIASVALGLAEFPLDAARQFAAVPRPSDEQFTLTLTHDLGYWMLMVTLALGIVVFFSSLADAFGDRRPGLNPWIAALGALATVVAVVGPLLPEGNALFSDNWYLTPGPGQASAALLAGRLAQLAMLLVTGVVGYLCVRRWGLGLAIGGALPVVWLAVSALFELTEHPVGPGYRNPGDPDSSLHGVTIIGISAIIAMAILALVAAYDQSTRERG